MTCIDCTLCRETARANFTRSDDGGYSYVFKQPTTPEEEDLCRQARKMPGRAIGRTAKGLSVIDHESETARRNRPANGRSGSGYVYAIVRSKLSMLAWLRQEVSGSLV